MLTNDLLVAYLAAWTPADGCEAVTTCVSRHARSPGDTLVDCLANFDAASLRPSALEDLAYLIDETGDDPTRLLMRAMRSKWTQDAPEIGRLFFGYHAERTVSSLGFDVADGHLHSGAALKLDDLISGLAGLVRPPVLEIERSRGTQSVHGDVETLRWLLAKVRWGFRYLWWVAEGGPAIGLDSADRDGLAADLVAAVADGTFWLIVDEERGGELGAGLYRAFPYRGRSPGAAVLLHAYIDKMYSRPYAGEFTIGLMRAVWELSQVITSRPGEGLSRFVDRFTLMGSIRDSALEELEEEHILFAVHRVVCSREVVGAEFRKSIRKQTADDFRLAAERALRRHLSAFCQYLESSGRSLALSMPITFSRRPYDESPHPRPIQELRHALAGAAAIRALLQEFPSVGPVVHAVDTVGPEVDSQNWPFLMAYGELAKVFGGDLCYTLHAGESFLHELTGLRKVGEALESNCGVRRVGHALALDSESARAIASSAERPVRLVDAYMDIAWAARTGVVDLGVATDLIQRIGSNLGPVASTISANSWLLACDCVYDIEKLRARGVVDGGTNVVSDSDLNSLARMARHDDRALLELVRGGSEECRIYRLLSSDEMSWYTTLAHEHLPRLREWTIAGVKRQGIVVETCPTSNVRLGGLAGYSSHPLSRFVASGLSATVSSDDPIIFDTSIIHEFEAALAVVDARVLVAIAAASVASCSNGVRRSLPDLLELIPPSWL